MVVVLIIIAWKTRYGERWGAGQEVGVYNQRAVPRPGHGAGDLSSVGSVRRSTTLPWVTLSLSFTNASDAGAEGDDNQIAPSSSRPSPVTTVPRRFRRILRPLEASSSRSIRNSLPVWTARRSVDRPPFIATMPLRLKTMGRVVLDLRVDRNAFRACRHPPRPAPP